MTHTFCTAFALVALPLVLFAQSPPRRAHHALVYDPVRERVLLTGGSSPHENGQCCAFFNDLWAFDGKRWTALPASGALMSGTRLAYDPHTRRVVSFGGYSGGRSMADVRVLDGDEWRTIGVHPSMAAAEPGFVFDRQRRRFIAFGGAGPGGTHGESWQYDGVTWTKLAGANPPARQAHVMVFDERRGRTVVFGGMGQRTPPDRPPVLGDLWELDGQRWSSIAALNGPSPRHSSGAAWDAQRGVVIVFGGIGADGFLGDTWSWDGARWQKLADASADGPEPRAMGQLAYDRKRDRVVLFGGRKGWPNGDLNDTWEWSQGRWQRIAQ